jgi:hypothetical protein
MVPAPVPSGPPPPTESFRPKFFISFLTGSIKKERAKRRKIIKAKIRAPILRAVLRLSWGGISFSWAWEALKKAICLLRLSGIAARFSKVVVRRFLSSSSVF